MAKRKETVSNKVYVNEKNFCNECRPDLKCKNESSTKSDVLDYDYCVDSFSVLRFIKDKKINDEDGD